MVYKKTRILSALIFSSALVLGACGENDEVTQPAGDDPQTEAPDTEETPPDDADEDSIEGDTFGFSEIHIEAGYPELDEAIVIEYEEAPENVSAEYKNRFTEEELAGDEAMQQMEESLEKLDLTADTPEEDAIFQIVEAFGFEEGYEYIEAEVQYPGGVEKEYNATGQ